MASVGRAIYVCETTPYTPVLSSVVSLAAFILAALCLLMHINNLVAAFFAGVGVASSLYTALLLRDISGTSLSLLALFYPLQGLAAYIAARRVYPVVREECKVWAAISIPLSIFTPLAVHFCIKPPLGEVVNGRPRRL